MSITPVTCVTVTCDHCKIVFTDEDGGYQVHFDSVSDAVEHIAHHDWCVTTEGRTICAQCWATQNCQRYAHIWGPWIPCHCQGRIPDHAEHGCGLFRICQRDHCNHHQDTTLAHLPTIDEPTPFGR